MSKDDQPTCGKGIAANAVMPERMASLLAAMADIYENHIRSLDPCSESGKQEVDAYERLARDFRAAATHVNALADTMRACRTLPMAEHNYDVLGDAQSIAAMESITIAQEALLAPLSERATEFRAMLNEMKEG